MHKSGHVGLSLFLCSPVFAVLLGLNLHIPATVFILSVATFASVPDIDIYLDEYDFTYKDIPIRYFAWIPIISLSNVIMNYYYKHTEKSSNKNTINQISHRGITHTIWFCLAFGIALVGVASFILLSVSLVDVFYDVSIYDQTISYYKYGTIAFVAIAFLSGFLSVLTHCIGDVITPAGLNFYSPKGGYGYSLDLFYAKNKVANRSSIIIAVISLTYGVAVGIPLIEISLLVSILGYIGVVLISIFVWLFFIKSGIGKIIYKIYDAVN